MPLLAHARGDLRVDVLHATKQRARVRLQPGHCVIRLAECDDQQPELQLGVIRSLPDGVFSLACVRVRARVCAYVRVRVCARAWLCARVVVCCALLSVLQAFVFGLVACC